MDQTTAPTQPTDSKPALTDDHHDHHRGRIEVFATGLENPRGLKFGPDGYLYVAEGGPGGADSTVGQCEQVIPPVGPYRGSPTGGRISKINKKGHRTTVTDNLPSSQTSPALGSLVSGVADVAFIGDHLYALLSGAGCSHGVADVPNGIVRVNRNGTWSLVANLSAFQQAHPVANPEPDDFEPDGTWYNMIAVDGKLYAVDPNHGELVRVTRNGRVSRVADISASQGHIVPTSLASHGRNFFVGNLNTFPIVDGSSRILRISSDGDVSVRVTGLTTVLGLAFDHDGHLFALENTTGNPGPTPNTGKVVRVHRNGKLDTVAEGLNLPTGMTFGPDGKLYISTGGFGGPSDSGVIVRVDVDDDDDHDDHDDD